MKPQVGQRWRYKNLSNDYIVEVIEINKDFDPVKVKVIYIFNSFSSKKMGEIYSSICLSEMERGCSKSDWLTLLFGQEIPNG